MLARTNTTTHKLECNLRRYINQLNLAHTPPVGAGVVDKHGVTKPYSLSFGGQRNDTDKQTFVELSSSWNGLVISSAGVTLGKSLSVSIELMCRDVTTQQAVFDWGTNAHSCALPNSDAHCSGEFVVSVDSGNVSARYLHPGYNARGYHYIETVVTAPIDASVWHTVELSITPSAGSVPGSSNATSDWTLKVDGVTVATATAQPEWRIGVPTFSRLGSAVVWPHDQGGAPFLGDIASFTVTPL